MTERVPDGAAAAFSDNRALLFTIAYEMLGSASDAEDVVQETYLRWVGVDHSMVDNPRSYLVKIATRTALNQLRTLRRRREEYVGSWVPEPIQTAGDVADDAMLAESVTMAMLLVLETLDPIERAVFVLREVFSYSYLEIADIVDKSPDNARQIAHRARSHIAARRRRFTPDKAESRAIIAAFFSAAKEGDLPTLENLLAADAVEMSDGGGKASAALRPIVGRAKVAAFAVGVARLKPDSSQQFVAVNGLPAVILADQNGVHTVIVFEISQGLVHGLYAIRNPDKLAHIAIPRNLTRGS